VETTREILESYRTWAIVGISDKPQRDAYRIARFLEDRGYRVVPVNPRLEVWEGKRCYPDLESIPFPVDVVDLFRRSEDVPPHVEEAIRIGAKAVWMQLGVENAGAAARAREAGLLVVENHCPAVETSRFWPEGGGPRFS